MITRRAFAAGSAALASSLAAPAALGQARPRLVVVGGGAGGATLAKYAAWTTNAAIDVTLIDASDNYTTCFHSNLYVAGFKSLEELTHSHEALAKYGVRKVKGFAQAIDRDRKQVVLSDGTRVPYDRLALSPGVDLDYDSVPGWSKALEEKAPHAWKAGPQTRLLVDLIDEVPDGGTIIMVAPPNPYRCPPGPYERVSMIAYRLKNTKREKARIIIIDPKETYSKQALFQAGWEAHYHGMVEWLGPKVHEGVKEVRVDKGEVVTGFDTFGGASLINVIPAQMAGAIARDAGLADKSRFCPIEPDSMRSKMDGNIQVIGDSCIAGDMPKSGFAANAQAKVAAMALRVDLLGARAFQPRFFNTCWSLIEPGDCVKVGGVYVPKDGKIATLQGFVSKLDESHDQRQKQSDENLGWYKSMTQDCFG
jgi:sulfide dehydrogenase [flavocytochrome c] flavoprotein subunit